MRVPNNCLELMSGLQEKKVCTGIWNWRIQCPNNF